MIELTKMNGEEFSLNPELIETVEEVPYTVITLTTGKKLFVRENRQMIKNMIILYKKEIFSHIL